MNYKNYEIERKFLIINELWDKIEKPDGEIYIQGYIQNKSGKTVRVRVAGNKGWLTIKGSSKGITRYEFEYNIPHEDAKIMLEQFTKNRIIKNRYKINYKGHLWEVDEFKGDNNGLILAEIELKSEDEYFEIPDWIGKEVSGEKYYYNAYLSKHPYKNWQHI
ncbi:CYTH domain-containing protein [bacterium]|nr:CYTH domain-containing protein [bacterium]